ncbi:MAG: ribonuclease catalytic domain-containing protein, partial [Vicinamibacterales bacterium]
MADQSQRGHLRSIAVRAMRERGLDPDFPQDALAQAAAIKSAPTTTEEPTRDLRGLLWCSIDNDDSRDLDQLSVAEALHDGDVRVLVAIADVDAAVAKGSPIDRHAALNTTSVYTPGVIFPMLPERLSTDLTSLADRQDRIAMVIEFVVSRDGALKSSLLYGATVNNKAKLAYNAVGAWLEHAGPLPPAAAAVAGMDQQLRMQDGVAQALDAVRVQHGALGFETIEVENVFDGDTLHEVRPQAPNRAKSLIANLMIAANGVTARFLDARGFPSLRRVVKSPERWDRIRALATQLGDTLPAAADSLALAAFLSRRKKADPQTFPDLSTSIIRLLGRGEYVVDPPGEEPPGHFGLAVRDYSHSTAPNRRFPDLVTQRLVKAALAGHRSPYGLGELEGIATQCTNQEDAANKVERQVRKSA